MVVIVSSGERIYEKPFYQKQRMSETPYLCSPFLNKVLPDVVKLVDTSDLGSDAARCGGSSPSIRTFLQVLWFKGLKVVFYSFKQIPVLLNHFGPPLNHST
jgi:hypothetical protein